MKQLIAAFAVLTIAGCQKMDSSSVTTSKQDTAAISQITYPTTAKKLVVDSYFGSEVVDNYRWLEDDMSAETADWVKRQNVTTQSYLAQIPYRQKLADRLTTLMDFERVGAPFDEGEHTYFYRNDGLQNQSVLYRKDQQGNSEVFLDPNTFSEDGTTSLAGLSFSKDGSLAAYQISEGGSDWRKVFVMDTKSKKILEAPLVDVKFSGISWLSNSGFYYSSYDKPKGSELSAKTDQHKVYFHTLGTKQDSDTLIFGGTEAEKHRYISGGATEDGRYQMISASISTSGNKLFLKDLQDPKGQLITVLDHTKSDTYLLDNKGSTLYFVTNLNAPNKRLVKVDAADPQPANWVDVIAETDNVLSVSTAGGYIFANYMIDAITKIEQYNYDGSKIRDITLPGVGSAGGFGAKSDAKISYYSFTNYHTPSTIFELNLDSGESKVYQRSKSVFDGSQYTSKQVFYTSKDGTKVPMIITHKKGLELNGDTPTILYGYGGFNVSLRPSFSSTRAAWLEQGGIYAVANLRGGGEYGKAWHNAGTQMQKQNVFDDFIAAAEYLIDQNYTSAKKLAVQGGSNGGLLVGAVMTQRPELFAVALPAVGVLDMLRYHTFTAGAGWAYDYGTANDSKAMFEYLRAYSPVHNVKANTQFPATMITTGDHDDRVVPAHSFKFAAELQDKQAGLAPTLIRIETDAGHGAGTPISKTIEQYADIYSFVLFNMGIEDL